MRYFLKAKEGRSGQEIFRPKHYKIEEGEEVEVDKATYDQHYDRNVFESRTENESTKSTNSDEEEEDSSESEQ